MRNKIGILATVALLFVGSVVVHGAIGFTYKYYTIIPGGIYAETGPIYKIGDNIAIKVGYSGTTYQLISVDSHAITKNLSTAPVESNGLPKGISFVNGEFLGVAQMPTTGVASTNQNYSYVVEGIAHMADGSTQPHTGFAQFQIKAPPCNPQISAPNFESTYINDTLTNRHFTPKIPVSPFDDIVIKINLAGCPISDVYIPSITTTTALGGTMRILQDNSFTKPTNSDIYEWKISGWPNGIVADQVKMEALIDSIVNGRKINVEVLKSTQPVNNTPIKKSITMNQCVRLYGDGGNRITFVREASVHGAVATFVTLASAHAGTFSSIEPYRTYSDMFKIALDLRGYLRPKWRLIDVGDSQRKEAWSTFFPADFSKCSNFSGRVVGITNLDSGSSNLVGFTQKGASKIFMTMATLFASPNVLTHEYSHAFARLSDEYRYNDDFPVTFTSKKSVIFSPSRNCSFTPATSFTYNSMLYADSFEKSCSYDMAVDPASPPDRSIFRSSMTSIMREGWLSSEFNVVSCGWIVGKITSSSGKSNFPLCASMQGIIGGAI